MASFSVFASWRPPSQMGSRWNGTDQTTGRVLGAQCRAVYSKTRWADFLIRSVAAFIAVRTLRLFFGRKALVGDAQADAADHREAAIVELLVDR